MQSTINRRIMTATMAGAFLFGPNVLVHLRRLREARGGSY